MGTASLHVNRGRDVCEQDEYILLTEFDLQNEEEYEVLDALADHLSRLEGVEVYRAGRGLQIRYTPMVVIEKKRIRHVSQTGS